MKVSKQWLSDYVDVSGYTGGELAEKLTRSGIEVDVVENRNKGVEGVVVGYVKSREKHPDADKLSVCVVDAGQGEDLQIVCGAANVAAGQKVPVALVGAKLPDGLVIKRAKLRGVESQGMICSARELAVNDKLLPKELQEGILVLPGETPVGTNILDVLALADEVLELDLTPNRSDCLSMLGAAYEIGAIVGRPVKLPKPEGEAAQGAEAGGFRVSIAAPDQCRQYAACVIEGVQVGASPLWLQNRLIAAGVRPISNIVDVTNYVMLEYGQPLHAFDAATLAGGRIEVRLAAPGERLVTLDGNDRALEPHMLVIADAEKPVALAGVMGGANSEVTAGTTRILLESAHFAGASVRRTSRQLGLRSESSLRFEKEVDPARVIPALQRAAALIRELAGGRSVGTAHAVAAAAAPVDVTINLARVNGYLGTSLALPEVTAIFDRLHFPYESAGDDTLLVHVPSRRDDITRDVDLIEEIARLYGYDNIPTTLMSGVTTAGSLSKPQRVRRSLRTLLSQSGVHEAIAYAFAHPDRQRQFAGLYPDARSVALAMPMSEERSVLRTSLVPHLIDAAVYNRNRNIDDCALFEIGNVFVTGETTLTKQPDERLLLALLLTGKRRAPHWSGKSEPVDYYDLKGLFEKIVASLGVSGVTYTPAQPQGYHPGRTAAIAIETTEGPVALGYIGQLHPQLQADSDLAETYVLEIELDTLTRYVDVAIQYKPLPRFPAVSRDIAVAVDRAVPVAALQAKAEQAAGELLESIHVFDVYTGERIGADKKSVALSLVYRHPERTLTDEEVAQLHSRVALELEQSFAAELRK